MSGPAGVGPVRAAGRARRAPSVRQRTARRRIGDETGGDVVIPTGPMATRPSLLVCDDAPGFRLIIQTVFEDGGFRVVGTADAWAEAEALARRLAPEAILLDLWLPTFERDGIRRVRAAAPAAVLAVVSSLAASEIGELTGDLEGIDLVLSKRDAPDVLLEAMLGALDHRPRQ